MAIVFVIVLWDCNCI